MKLELDQNIYPIETIFGAAYLFIDRAYIFLDEDRKSKKIQVSIKSKKPLSKKNLESLRMEFMNELVHSRLRQIIAKNNKKIRDYIVGRALSSAFPISETQAFDEKIDSMQDPLGIAVPWEKKYGKKK